MPRQRKPGGTGDGLPVVGVRMSPELSQWVKEKSKKERVTIPDYIRSLLIREMVKDFMFLDDGITIENAEQYCVERRKEIESVTKRVKEWEKAIEDFKQGKPLDNILCVIDFKEWTLSHINLKKSKTDENVINYSHPGTFAAVTPRFKTNKE